MASCKECLCFDVCSIAEIMGENFCCPDCKDRNRFVELPCKVGDTVYQTDDIRIYENKIERIIFDTNNFGFDETSIGKSIFLTREEAERALNNPAKSDS